MNRPQAYSTYTVICVKVATYLPLYRGYSLKNTMSGNFQKLKINAYTWNFGKYDAPSEKQQVDFYIEFIRLPEMMPY